MIRDFLEGCAVGAIIGLAGCSAFAFLHDPNTGCGGNSLSTICPDKTCAPPGYRCVPQGGWELDENQWGPGTAQGYKSKDATVGE